MKRFVFLLISIFLFFSHISFGQIASLEGNYSLLIKPDGSLWAWGDNSNGQLGDGTTTNRNSPVNILPNSKWIAVATSNYTSFGIKKDGTLWVWGSNSNCNGIFGNNNLTIVKKLVPEQVGTDTNWKSICVNDMFAVGLKTDGTIWNWGNNYSGILGDGTTTSKNIPTKLGTGSDWSSISINYGNTYAIKQNGTLWAWGYNNGLLGNGLMTSSNVPVQINNDTNWKSIDASNDHILAIKQDGSLYAWGQNNYGQLGFAASNNYSIAPVRIGTDNDWSKISAGSYNSLAVKSNGSLWSWGDNSLGKNGRTPGLITHQPVQLSGNWSDVYIGTNTTIGIKNDSGIWVWGSNNYGLLGLGSDPFKKTPTQVTSNIGWKEICTNDLTTFGIKLDGTLWAWGDNNFGIYNSNRISSNIPVQIGTGTNWKTITAVWGSVAAIKTDGTLWTWGKNTNGELGSGYPTESYTISQRGTDTNWDKIYGIGSNIFAIKTNGSLWGWGGNWNNSINGSNFTILSPTQIGTDLNWKSIGASYDFTIGLKTDGSLWSWGKNFPGNLGFISNGNSFSTPQRIGSATDWTELSTNYIGTIALKSDGTMWAWGSNYNGNLGFNPSTTSSLNVPTQITLLNNIRSVASYFNYSLAIKTDGSLYSWGTNSNGNLGDGTTVNNFTSAVRIGTASNWSKIYTGTSQSTFAIKSDGSLWAWGQNLNGDLGIGEFGYISERTLLFAPTSTSKPKIFASSNSSFQIKADGTLWAWGLNTSGQLGLGDKINRNYAVQVGTDADWEMVSHSVTFTIALKKDGSLWAWGYNGGNGYLGIGNTTTTESLVPVRIGTANDWKSVSAGINHSLALKTNGTLWAWGYNLFGALGDGTTVSKSSPIQIGSATDWESIAATNNSSYAIKTLGSLWAWGLNGNGQLGDGSTTTRNSPVQIGSSSDWKKINGGNGYAMALKSNGSLWGWGYGAEGNLGNNFTSTNLIPTQIGSETNWSDISITPDGTSSVALKTNGTLWATGYNLYGSSGTGSNVNLGIFTQVGNSTNWSSVASGRYFTLALDNQNKLYAWGSILHGALNKGEFSFNRNIRQIGSDLNWDKVYAGYYHSGGIKKDGTLWMWGRNNYGQLGDGTILNNSTPTQLGSDNNWKTLTLSYFHSLALKTNGTIWSWGDNTYGQLGDGSTTDKTSPSQIGVDTDWKLISSGYNSSYGIKNNGTLWAWGLNSYGQLGNGSTTTILTPTQIGSATDWVSISAGYGHVLAIKSNGTLWAWGLNSVGQLGNGNTTNSTTPIQIGTDTDWKSVQPGLDQSTAMKRDGTVWTWGYNFEGELGDGTNTNRLVPTRIILDNVAKWPITMFAGHNFVIKNDGSVYSWGYNYYGQLGDGTSIDRNVPIQMGTEIDWKDISSGGYHSMAIKNDGSLWSWGNDLFGQLGQGRDYNYTPSEAKPIASITQASRSTYCATGNMVLTASEGLSYTWSTGATTRSITVNTSGTYSVTITYPIGDVSTSESVFVTTRPNTTISTTGSMTVNRLEDLKTYKLTVPATNGHSFQWYNNGTAISGATSNYFVPKKNGIYSVTVTNNTGCVSSSITKTVTYALADTLTPAKVLAVSNSSFLIKPNGTLWAWGNNTGGQLGLGDKTNRGYAVQVGTSADWKTVVSNGSFTLALKKDGSIWSWGYNGSNGYLGIGNTNLTESLIPVRIGTANNWESIAVGNSHSIAIKTDGTIWAWGYNYYGQLGDGTTTGKSAPVQIGTDNDWSSISAGNNSTYAIKTNGSLYAWGYNYSSQLGDGTTNNKNTPTRVGTENDWGLVNAGSYFAMALKTDGSLWGWGSNYSGQLGSSNYSVIANPVKINNDVNWVNLFVSVSNSGNSFALKSNGTLWATGINTYGQLGQNNTSSVSAFTQIGSNTSWRSAAIGSGHVLALDNLNKLYSWGYNMNGQVGNGKFGYVPEIKQVGADNNWDKITAGFYHSAGIKKDGTLWTWGRNNYGQVGDGSTINKESPTQIGSATNWKSVSLGFYHTVGLKTDGSIWAWGLNSSGELGDGGSSSQLIPVQIGSSTDWKIVSVGNRYTIALKNNGTLWAWGSNSSGQLGNGTNTNSNTPIQIGTATDWISISSGSDHVMALKSNGTIWTWGYNYNGQLGTGNTTDSNIPVQIGVETDWTSIHAGGDHSFASKSNGTEWAWGYNSEGELGDGSVIEKYVPTQINISNIKKWSNSILGYHNAVIKTDGTLWGWGYNYTGQIGDGTMVDKKSAIKIGTENDWNQIAVGYSHSLAIKTDGSLWAWGYNFYGQLGYSLPVYKTPTLTKPIVEINTSNKANFCTGGNLVLTASEGLSYTWSTGATTRSITVNTPGNYQVTVTYPIGDVVSSDVLSISAIQNLTISTAGSMIQNRLEDLKTYKLSVPAVAGQNYQWFNNGELIPGAISNTFIPRKNGNYSVTAINSTSCAASSISKTVTYAQSDTLTPAKVFAGSNSSFLIKPNGTLWAWGSNGNGQLGIGNKTNQSIAVQVGTATDWKMVATTTSFTIAIKKDGSMWGWGFNGNTGYLGIGDGTILESLTPVRIGTSNDWESISVGYNHTIALKTNGTIWSWGYNYYGALGDGTTTTRISPTQIGNDSDWLAISAGGYSTYALKSNGLLFAWGQNTSGQLGDGTTVNRNVPTQIGNSNDWGIIDGGNNYAFALKTDGTMWGWGYNSYNKFGTTQPSFVSSPIQIGTDSNWSNLINVASGSSSLALKSNGTVWGVGYNYYGQLGQGNTGAYSNFTQIGNSTDWRSATVGSSHVLALDKQNNLFSWGLNSAGQLAKGNFSFNKSIKQVGNELTWEKIFVSTYRSYAIKKDGTLWAWGNNDLGQLGNSSDSNLDIAVQIGTGTNWQTLALGSTRTLGLKTDGTLWAWGGNDDGAIGDGTNLSKTLPIQIGNATDWASIYSSAGTSFAIKKNGTLWAWGYNYDGQMGNGNNTSSNTPIQIGTSSDWVSISAGLYHVLGLKSNGTIWAWGYNYYGQLGNGNNTNSNIPIQIGSATDWMSIETGGYQSYAMKKDGTLWAWGYNQRGELGDGTNTDKNIPTPININNISKLSRSGFSYHKMLTKTDGTLWGWGYNYYGALGDESTINKNIPTKIGTETDWKEVATGSYHTLALKTDGSLWSWGYNIFGQLGDGKAFYYTPTLAKPIVDIVPTGRKTFCPGGSVVLTASEGGLSYTWSTGAKTRSITVNTTGNYYVTATYPIGDVSTSESTMITVNLPDVNISTTGSSFVFNLTDTKTYTLKVPAVTGSKYQWAKDGVNISGATTAEYIPQSDGTYSVNVTSPLGCVANSIGKVVKYELADTDGDGIKDNADKCNNTVAGAIIDANGCEIFTLPAKNYTIGLGSATCVGSTNGSIQITFANKNYSYLVKAVGATSGYSKQFTYSAGETAAFSITGLAKDSYSVCIQVLGKDGYEQCFDVLVTEPAPLKTTSSFNPTSNTVVLDLSGSTSYSISINGNVEKVNSNTFSKVLSTGLNKIIVSTDLGCQGTVEQEIFISEQAQAFPNPTSGIVSIYVPGSDTSVRVSIYSLEKTLLDESRDLDNSRTITYDLSKMDSGTYIIQVSGSHVNKTLKISKQ